MRVLWTAPAPVIAWAMVADKGHVVTLTSKKKGRYVRAYRAASPFRRLSVGSTRQMGFASPKGI